MTPELQAFAERLLTAIERIATALEEIPSALNRRAVKAESSTLPERRYLSEEPPKEPTDGHTQSPGIRRPRQASRS